MTLLRWLPGWLLMAGMALACMWVSAQIVYGGKEPVEASALVVVLGVVLRNTVGLPKVFVPGVKAAEKLLVLGIVLLGFQLDYHKILNQGLPILGVILGTMSVGFAVTYGVSRLGKLSEKLSVLLAVGTTICGGTAVALTAPLIRAKEEETSYAVAVIALWGVAAILIYPAVADALGIGAFPFGVFAGTAIHSTPQVVGAGFIHSQEAGETATAVKLVRNCFMAPLALVIALWYARKNAGQQQDGVKVNFAKAFPWFLFAYFITSWIGTQGWVDKEWMKHAETAGKFLIILGMAGVGLNTDLAAIRRVGWLPLVVGLIGALVVAATSALLIYFVLQPTI